MRSSSPAEAADAAAFLTTQSAVTQLFEHPPRPGSPRRQAPDLTSKPPLPRPPKPPQTARPRPSAAERAEAAKVEAARREAAEAQQAKLNLGVEEQVAVMVVRRDALLKRRAETLLGGRQRAFDADEEWRRSEEKHAAGEELKRERRRRLREHAEAKRREEVEAQQAKLTAQLRENEQARAAQQVRTRAAEEAARESAAEEARHGRQIEATRRRQDQIAADSSRQARTAARNAAVGRYEEYRQSAEQAAAERYGAEVAARRAKARQALDTHDGVRQRVEEQAEASSRELEEQKRAVEERFQEESRVLEQQKKERAGRMRDQDKRERRHAAGVMERMRGMEAARVANTEEQQKIMEERSAAQQKRCEGWRRRAVACTHTVHGTWTWNMDMGMDMDMGGGGGGGSMRGLATLLTYGCRCEVNHEGWMQYQALQAQNAKMRVEEAQARQQARRERKQQANADKEEYIASLAAARARRDEHIRNLAQEFAAKQARLEAVMLEADFRGEVPQPEAVEAALRDLPSGAPGAGASLAFATAVRAREGALEKARERASERREERERERVKARASPRQVAAPPGGAGLPMWNPADSPAPGAEGSPRRARGRATGRPGPAGVAEGKPHEGKQNKLFGLISEYGA